MNAVFEVLRPDEVQFSMTLTMPLSQWKDLREQLAQAWPSSDLSQSITSMVLQAQKSFYPEKSETIADPSK